MQKLIGAIEGDPGLLPCPGESVVVRLECENGGRSSGQQFEIVGPRRMSLGQLGKGTAGHLLHPDRALVRQRGQCLLCGPVMHLGIFGRTLCGPLRGEVGRTGRGAGRTRMGRGATDGTPTPCSQGSG